MITVCFLTGVPPVPSSPGEKLLSDSRATVFKALLATAAVRVGRTTLPDFSSVPAILSRLSGLKLPLAGFIVERFPSLGVGWGAVGGIRPASTSENLLLSPGRNRLGGENDGLEGQGEWEGEEGEDDVSLFEKADGRRFSVD